MNYGPFPGDGSGSDWSGIRSLLRSPAARVRIRRSGLGLDHTVGISFSLVNDGDLLGLRVDKYKEVVSQEFHLYAGIFRIHGLEVKLFLADDPDVFVLVVVALNIFALEGRSLLMTLDQFVLILL